MTKVAVWAAAAIPCGAGTVPDCPNCPLTCGGLSPYTPTRANSSASLSQSMIASANVYCT